MATVCVISGTGRKNLPTVNVIAGTAPKGGKNHKQATAASNTLGQFKIYQATASPVAGLPTVWISGYSGPA